MRWLLASAILLMACGNGGDPHGSLVSELRTPLAEREPGTNFHIAARTPHLEQFPCTRCHAQPVVSSRDATKAHWRIELRHAAMETMTCDTCHGGGDRSVLRLLAGGVVPFDQSYRVCAQCHSTQFADWKGGAHGKRSTGWAEDRVAMNCSACHDPHAPAFESRWPARAPGLRR